MSSGVIRLLRQDDYVVSTYRDHVHALSKGVPAREVMAELFGKKTGCCRCEGALQCSCGIAAGYRCRISLTGSRRKRSLAGGCVGREGAWGGGVQGGTLGARGQTKVLLRVGMLRPSDG